MSYKILTIDDSRMARLVVTKTFKPFGCEVIEAATGTDGLVCAATERPDLIFLDITMADLNGLVVLEKLREVPELQATPVVMVTAESGASSIARADKLGVIGYIPKPFKGEQLLALANTVLQLQPVAT